MRGHYGPVRPNRAAVPRGSSVPGFFSQLLREWCRGRIQNACKSLVVVHLRTIGGLGTSLKLRKISGEGSEAKASSQTERATLALREMLVKGQFRPGERIREVPLAAELKVSRIPLHLALERLAHEGFLDVRPTRGFVVQQFSTEDIYDAIELRGLLEGAAARLAVQRMKDVRDLQPMREAAEEILALVRRPKLNVEAFKRYIGLNEKFHAALRDLSRSRMLKRSIEQACSLPFASPGAFLERQFISGALHELFLVSADQHCSIVEAIANRDAFRAEMLTREHAQVARRNLEDALKYQERIPDLAGAKLVSL